MYNIAVTYTDKNGQNITEYLKDIPLNNIYEEVGKFFPLIAIPSTLEAIVNDGTGNYTLRYEAKQRGSYIKDGVTIPSMFVTVKKDEVLKSFSSELNFSNLKECYLTCINFESNNYKYYHMTPTTNGIEVEYGRIGSEAGEMFGKRNVQNPYHPSLYWVRYYEKLSKGYTDNSKAYLTTKVRKSPKKATEDKNESNTEETSSKVSEVEAELYNILFAYSKNHVRPHLVSDKITAGQVANAKKIFTALCNRKTVKGFNNQLMKLM
jgi:poly [ADP-ribose] polymerase